MVKEWGRRRRGKEKRESYKINVGIGRFTDKGVLKKCHVKLRIFMKKTLLLLLVLANVSLSLLAINKKPFTIPEIKEWKGGEGMLECSGRICWNSKEELHVANQLAVDYETMFGRKLTVSGEKARKGDIVLRLKGPKKLGEEGYTMAIEDQIVVMAAHRKGLYWATRTLLQLFEQTKSRALPRGFISDKPDYPFRGFMLDCGRKFFSMDMLCDYVRMMAYYKMNVFHIHLNDNAFSWFYNGDWNRTPAAFRLESEYFPGLTARDGHYTKDEFVALQRLATDVGVEIIPEIDVPAHCLALTRYRPNLASKEYSPDHLDLFNPQTWDFCDSLFTEYLSGPFPVFRGKYVHVGTDEYSNKDQNVVEKFRSFTDHYIKLVEKFGRKAVIWGQQTHAKGSTPIKVKDVLMYAWYNGYANPKDMMELGYHLVSIPDGQVYIVPKAGYYFDYLNTRKLYAEWTPADINGMKFEERHKMIEGGAFAVWNDIAGNGISDKDVHYRVLPALRTMATKMWTGARPTFAYDDFVEAGKLLSEAPGLNYAGYYPKGRVLEVASVEPGASFEPAQIGWQYRVSFDIEACEEDRGTVLLANGDTKFYLSDPISGKIGFSRDGYLNTFDYQFHPGEKAHVTVVGNQETTTLYVNGRMVSDLPVRKMSFGKRGDMYYISTLVFPLRQAGRFKSKVTKLRVDSEV